MSGTAGSPSLEEGEGHHPCCLAENVGTLICKQRKSRVNNQRSPNLREDMRKTYKKIRYPQEFGPLLTCEQLPDLLAVVV